MRSRERRFTLHILKNNVFNPAARQKVERRSGKRFAFDAGVYIFQKDDRTPERRIFGKLERRLFKQRRGVLPRVAVPMLDQPKWRTVRTSAQAPAPLPQSADILARQQIKDMLAQVVIWNRVGQNESPHSFENFNGAGPRFF